MEENEVNTAGEVEVEGRRKKIDLEMCENWGEGDKFKW